MFLHFKVKTAELARQRFRKHLGILHNYFFYGIIGYLRKACRKIMEQILVFLDRNYPFEYYIRFMLHPKGIATRLLYYITLMHCFQAVS